MNDNKIPVWFWILAGIALLWNVMGLYAFYTDMTITPEGIAALPADERGLYENEPLWAKIVFGGAVVTGVLGSLGLLLRQGWAKTVLMLSVVFVLAQMAHGFMSDAYTIMGSGTLIFAIVILVFALLLVWFAGVAKKKGWTG